jgi:hypothetical protein
LHLVEKPALTPEQQAAQVKAKEAALKADARAKAAAAEMIRLWGL